MTIKQAIEYLQPIADSAQLAGYSAALNVAMNAMREVECLREELKDERYRHDRQADFTVGQGKKIDQLKEELEAVRDFERSQPVDNEDNIFRAALETFGIESQIIKLVEETGEFFEAFGKCLGGRDKVDHVAEEMADVHNMLDQFAVYFDCEAEVERQRRYKLKRLEQRIEEARNAGQT